MPLMSEIGDELTTSTVFESQRTQHSPEGRLSILGVGVRDDHVHNAPPPTAALSTADLTASSDCAAPFSAAAWG